MAQLCHPSTQETEEGVSGSWVQGQPTYLHKLRSNFQAILEQCETLPKSKAKYQPTKTNKQKAWAGDEWRQIQSTHKSSDHPATDIHVEGPSAACTVHWPSPFPAPWQLSSPCFSDGGRHNSEAPVYLPLTYRFAFNLWLCTRLQPISPNSHTNNFFSSPCDRFQICDNSYQGLWNISF